MTATSDRHLLGSWIWRGAGYFAFWVLLIGFKPADLAVGVGAAVAATWASLALLPPGMLRVRPAGLPRYALRFFWQSVVAGVDVARRAFAPRVRVHPGMIRYATRYPRGAARNTFASLTGLLPGTVVVDDDASGLLFHCLDRGQPIIDQLTAEEAAMARALPREPVP